MARQFHWQSSSIHVPKSRKPLRSQNSQSQCKPLHPQLMQPNTCSHSIHLNTQKAYVHLALTLPLTFPVGYPQSIQLICSLLTDELSIPWSITAIDQRLHHFLQPRVQIPAVWGPLKPVKTTNIIACYLPEWYLIGLDSLADGPEFGVADLEDLGVDFAEVCDDFEKEFVGEGENVCAFLRGLGAWHREVRLASRDAIGQWKMNWLGRVESVLLVDGFFGDDDAMLLLCVWDDCSSIFCNCRRSF